MAASNECSEGSQAQVLLVDPQTLPVLLQSSSGSSVDLLQQALQGTSAIEDEDEGGSSGCAAGEVSLGALSEGNSDVVTIYQGDGGQTHTIKLSLAEAESLGLHFSDERVPLSLDSNTLVNDLKVTSLGESLAVASDSTSHSLPLTDSSLLQGVACSNMPNEGRMIDEDGNIVETTGTLHLLPTSLTSLLEDGVSQALSIIPQYELDGSVTYAVRLKDQNDVVLGTDYHVLEPDSSAKTGLDIEEELKNASLKQNILHSSGSLGLGTSVTLNENSNALSSSIHVPINTLDALTKQMLLPVSSSSVPISVTLPISSIASEPSNVSSSVSLAASNNRIFQIVDSSSVGMNNLLATDSSAASLNTLLPQSIIPSNQQHSQLINQSSTMLTMQNNVAVSLGSTQRPQILSNKLSSILSSTKGIPTSTVRNIPAFKKVPQCTNVATPITTSSTTVLSPPKVNTSVPSSGNISKSASFLNGRPSLSNSKSSKPLGSSENPIQLVQQGQTFHSMQALSDAQLRQIATVLQQKHLNSNSTATKNVLFDEQTKTRIVYRVVYPEDVDLQQPSSPIEKAGSSANQAGKGTIRAKGRRGRPKRGKRAKQVSEKNGQKEDQLVLPQSLQGADHRKHVEKDEGPTLEDIPKLEKKKTLGSRTRSGRVSRPPKHMMKDYKRLHHVDFRDRDVDDSDGGYSDYSNPEQPLENPIEEPPVIEIEPNITPAKKRMSRFTCPTCKKLYLGLGRMEKHFVQHPDHGSFEEFKQNLSASKPGVNTKEDATGDKESTSSAVKSSLPRGKKRSQESTLSKKERSEIRKKKLKEALQTCEISEVMEVAGPLIARYYSLWDMLLLRLHIRDESNYAKENLIDCSQNHEGGISNELNTFEKESNNFAIGNHLENSQRLHATSNRVQWLLMELRSLTDTLQSMANDLFLPAHMHEDDKVQVEISEKTVSELFGVSCGTYTVNEQLLFEKMENFTSGFHNKVFVDLGSPPEKRTCKSVEEVDETRTLNQKDGETCSDDLSSLSLMVKPDDSEKVMLAKLTDDMPFLNSSDDMLCGSEDPDLSTDSKRDQDCDSASNIQVVDDIVNERLKNLSANMSFSVQLPASLTNADMKRGQSELHLMSSFSGGENSMSVNNSSVISDSLTDSNKTTGRVPNLDLISSYSMSSLSPTVSGVHDVNISTSETSNDLASALEPVTSQSMLGSFAMGLSSLSSFDALQSQSSNVSHSDDSFLDSLSSFESRLTQSCSSSSVPGSSYDDGVIKSSALLELGSESTEPRQLPPKFISSFTPAITPDKTGNSISTAQRLQRTYLDLDSGLDDGLDLDFEALTEELNMNRSNRL